ncbi:MAG: autotransporter outer membrane beta-barrel domain-containing protein, partial [Gammaproteobacteria bacterium]|nr:autotransporter outer membrane beta-barrel domain-containing protein [Gammaproteobacteria bacterium]
LGIDFNRGNWDIATTVSVAYRDIDIDWWPETDTASTNGGLSLAYAEQTIESFRSILALSFTGTYSREFGVLSPHFRMEWHHEFQDDPLYLLAKYVEENTLNAMGVAGAAGPHVWSLTPGECLSCFSLKSDEIDTDFALVGIGLSAVFSRRVQIYGVYDALLGISDTTSNSFSVGIRGQF